MGLQLELYFKGEDFKKLMEQNPDSVIITCETKRIIKNLVVLTSVAQGRDVNSNPTGSPANGCPTPCHPIDGDYSCLNESKTLLELYISQGYF